MPNSRSPDQWAYRHRVQHNTRKPVDRNTSARFAREFEQAVRQRGAVAAEGSKKETA